MVAAHECRMTHEPDDPDPIHVCARCGHPPDIDRPSSPVVDSLSENPAPTTKENEMPKLDNTTAKAVHTAEGTGFTLVDEDQYRIKLEKVVVSPKPDVNGNTYWIWSFSIVSGQTTGDKFKGKPLRTQTGFTENQRWFAKMIFEAFEAKPNVDTDTLLGKEVLAIVGQGEQTSGRNKGKMRNEVQTLMSVNSAVDEGWDDDSGNGTKAAEPADDESEPDF